MKFMNQLKIDMRIKFKTFENSSRNQFKIIRTIKEWATLISEELKYIGTLCVDFLQIEMTIYMSMKLHKST